MNDTRRLHDNRFLGPVLRVTKEIGGVIQRWVDLALTMKTMRYLAADGVYSDRCCYDLEMFSIDAGLVEIEMLRGRGLGL